MSTGVNAILARPRIITIVALGILIAAAWAWILGGTAMGHGAPPDEATMGGMVMEPSASWSIDRLAIVFSMWWTMMVAMMLPSAAPTILLYERVARNVPQGRTPAVAGFLCGYLLAWGLFSAIATLMQFWLTRWALIAPLTMASQSTRLSGMILIAAGAYQLSPLKSACLRHCQNPAGFLSRHYRDGTFGALRMGALHGAICIGCCWLLMALLFVAGVMNVVWIVLLTILVASEKLLPLDRVISVIVGLACLIGGGLMLWP
ncbi:MAG: DUF2182 domain-containing protein [Pseudomonadota bacterium]